MKKFVVTLGLLLVAVSPALAEDTPQFTLAWSEYPSWSVFGVASNADVGLLNGKAGEMGEIEEKYNVDIVLKLADYDTCLVMYGSAQVDAVCITNMDILNPSLKRRSVAIMPTSTSHGADALIVRGDITSIEQLKGKRIYGLAKTVSEYMFARNIEKLGGDPADYDFTNMDPGAASMAMQQRQEGIDAIAVWQPFVLQTLNQRKDVRVLFDSTSIPGEIIDMVVMSDDSLKREGGDRAAKAICETFYRMSARLNNASTRDDTLVALGEKFANLTVKHMRQIVRQTKFYGTPKEGIQVFTNPELKTTMDKVAEFCVRSEMLGGKRPNIAYGSSQGNLRFDPSFMKAVANSVNCPMDCTKPCCSNSKN